MGTCTRFRSFGNGVKIAEKIKVHRSITLKNFKIVPQKPEFKIRRYPYQVDIGSSDYSNHPQPTQNNHCLVGIECFFFRAQFGHHIF